MAKFADYQHPMNAPSYVGLSKEPDRIKPNPALGKLFETLGDTFEQGVKSADILIKQQAEKEVTAMSEKFVQQETQELEAFRDELKAGGKPVSDPSASAQPGQKMGFAEEDPRVAGQVEAEMNRLARMQQAQGQGKVRSTQMEMEARAALSAMKSRYGPGYSRMIEAAASRAGIPTAGSYLTHLRSEVNELLNAKDEKEKFFRNWEQTNAKYLGGDWFKRSPMERRALFETNPQVQVEVANRKSLEFEIDRDNKLMDTLHKKDQVDANLQERVSTAHANRIVSAEIDKVLVSAGNYEEGAIFKAVQEAKRQNRPLSPDEVMALGQAVSAIKLSASAKLDAYGRTATQDGGTIMGRMGAAKWKAMKDAVLESAFAPYEAAIGGKEFTFSIATAASDINKLRISAEGERMTRQWPGTAGLTWMQQNLPGKVVEDVWNAGRGPGGLQSQMFEGPGKYLTSNFTAAIAGGQAKNPQTQKPVTVSEIADEYERFGIDTKGLGRNMATLMDRIHVGIMHPQGTPELTANMAKTVFTDHRLFTRIPENQRLAFLQKFTNKEVTERIYGTGDRELQQHYRNWIADATRTTIGTAATDIKEAQQEGVFSDPSTFNLTYNPGTQQIEVRALPPDQLLNKPMNERQMEGRGAIYQLLDADKSTGFNAAVSLYQIGKVQRAVAPVNEALRSLSAVLKKEGVPMDDSLVSILNQMGIQVKAPPATPGQGKPGEGKSEAPKEKAGASGKSSFLDEASPDYKGEQVSQIGGDGLVDYAQMAYAAGDNQQNFPIQVGAKYANLGPDRYGNDPLANARGGVRINDSGNMQGEYKKQLERDRMMDKKMPIGPGTPDMSQEDLDEEAEGTNRQMSRKDRLREFISGAEVRGQDKYNTVYGGRKFPLTEMTVGEVLSAQSGMKNTAAGKYQVLRKTLQGLVRSGVVSKDDMFDEKTQDRIADYLLDKRGYSKFESGKMSKEQLVNSLAKEWAGLPNMSGRSAYHGYAGNRATVSLNQFLSALNEE